MNPITALIAILNQGSTVANPKAWQTGQVTANIIGGLLLAIVNALPAFHIAIPFQIDQTTANGIGAGILAIVNVAMSAASHPHIGLIAESSENTKVDNPPAK